MNPQKVVAWLNNLAIARTGKSLSDLERAILHRVWEGQKYIEIAIRYGYTEGHVKDVSSALWRFLSQELGERITKTNFRSAIARYYRSQTDSVESLPPATSFLGRSEAIAHLTQLLDRGAKVIVIQGEGGAGKTTLAQQYLQSQCDLILELLIAKERQNLVSAERVVEEWLQQDLGIEPGTEFGVSLARLKRQLHQRRVGILIDNLEPTLDSRGRFIETHRSYVELLRVLSDARVQSVTLVTSRDRLCESSLNATHYRLPGLDFKAWEQFFKVHGISIQESQVQSFQQLHRAYGGNAKAMELLCGGIQTDFASDVQAYWQEYEDDLLAVADLKDLISTQVERLRSLDPQAYRLFCRLGCYRYQAIPVLPIEALTALLWDVPATEQRQAIVSLRNRSLLEYDNSKYWLHPAIRAEAVSRLRESDSDWERANRQAADFWTQSVLSIETTKDALQALEAYYHYTEIADFAAAGGVLLKSRNNQWKQYLPLGSTLYRMGLIQPVIAAITEVIEKVPADASSIELYNILGDVWWITGKVRSAISCQEKAIALVTVALESLPDLPEHKHAIYCLKMLEIDSMLSIGLYRVDLWELTEAGALFQQVIQQGENTPFQAWADKASICLGLVNSYLGLPHEVTESAIAPRGQRVRVASRREAIADNYGESGGRFAYFIQILAQTYVNLGQYERAVSLFQTALEFARSGHYKQVEGRILIGMAEIYRIWGNFEQAMVCHAQAIDLLEQIGAKCDLAEALFQQAITEREMGKEIVSQDNFARSIQLFEALKAPKQVEKVRLRMN